MLQEFAEIKIIDQFIAREKILESLIKGLEKDSVVFALWLEGADANNTVDEYSDIDVWLDVKDGEEKKIFCKVEKILSKLGKLDLKYTLDHPHPKIRQKMYHLQNTAPTLFIDLCIQQHSRIFWFTKEHQHEKPLTIFDKVNVLKFRKLDHKEWKKEVKAIIEDSKGTIAQAERVTGKIKRKDFLEALYYYHRWVLQPLVRLLRLRYSAFKHDYYLKHVSRDLPPAIVKQLENLYQANSVEDIQTKIKSAKKLFQKTLMNLS